MSDSAGRKFKSDDMENCTDLIFELQKVEGASETLYIKAGDTVALKQRSSRGINLVSCSDPDKQCRAKQNCVSGNGEGKMFDDLICPEDVFIVEAIGKRNGEQIRHRDSVTFRVPYTQPSASGQMNQSLFRCKINEDDTNGECERLDCADNNIIGEPGISTECDKQYPFIVKKL